MPNNVVGFKINGQTYKYDAGELANIPAIDPEPVQNSTRAVQSGGVFGAAKKLDDFVKAGLSIVKVNLKSLMVDHDKVYLYTGSEPNESTGYWYHWNGTQFVPGGLYGAGVQIDSTPTQGSTNAVSSGGVYETLDTLQAQISQIDTDEFDRKIYAAYVTDTASGSIASFPDGADDIPLKSCIVRVEPVQAGSGDPSPENERPITGWTGCKVQRTGKNLWNPSDVFTGFINNNTNTIQSNSTGKICYICATPNTTYTVSKMAGERFSVACSDVKPALNASLYGTILNYTGTSITITTGNSTKYLLAWCYLGSVDTATEAEMLASVQIELGSSATEYDPYSGQTYDITFPAEAGTVYGGILDVTQGKLTITTGIINLGTLKYTKNNNVQYAYASINGMAVNPIIHCDSYEVVPNQTSASSIQNAQIKGRASDNIIFIRNDDFSTGSEYKTGLNGCYLTYTLAESKVYYLALHEIRTLLGTNNIWADCGDVSVEYRADTTMYIKRLTDSDTDMVADANIVSGQYFMVGNDLYKATANIASGASVIAGTNATKISLAQALNEINQ